MRVSKRVQDRLWELVRLAPGVEVCGFIDLTNQVVIPLTNVDPEPAHHYTADAKELVEAVVELRRNGADFAVYHSHPTTPAIPSKGDKESSGTYTKQVILAPRTADLRAWSVRGGKWTEVAVNQEESE